MSRSWLVIRYILLATNRHYERCLASPCGPTVVGAPTGTRVAFNTYSDNGCTAVIATGPPGVQAWPVANTAARIGGVVCASLSSAMSGGVWMFRAWIVLGLASIAHRRSLQSVRSLGWMNYEGLPRRRERHLPTECSCELKHHPRWCLTSKFVVHYRVRAFVAVGQSPQFQGLFPEGV